MDPNQTLSDILTLAASLIAPSTRKSYGSQEERDADVDELCEKIINLDQWLYCGGAKPGRWRKTEVMRGENQDREG